MVNFDTMFATIEEMINAMTAALPKIGLAVVMFAVFVFVGRGLHWTVRRVIARRGRRHNVGLVLGRLANWTIVLAGLFVALTIVLPTFRAGDLIQLLGIGGVAIGFAFRDILQNFLAGILLLLTEPFRIGDQIVVENFEGTVEDIETRATTIVTYDGRRVVIPNADLFTKAVIVNTAYTERRVEVDIGIGYGDDVERAKKLILETVGSIDSVLAEPAPDVIVVRLADYSVNLRVRWWIRPPRRADAMDARDSVLAAIKRSLQEHGIDLPFPTQQILFHDQTEETDGDRSAQREGWPPAPGEQVPASRSIAGSLAKLAVNTPRDQGRGEPGPDRTPRT